jgi:hypothetical protein
MKLNVVKVDPFFARITLGAHVGYTDKMISELEMISFIQNYQDMLIEKKNMYLSVSLSHCKIILSGQVEPHFQLSFINYPRFSVGVKKLKREIICLTQALLEEFSQNRIVTEFPDKTIMFERSENVDPRVKTQKNKKLCIERTTSKS